MKVEGGCYCGQVRYEVEGDPVFKGQCHCRECQYITGGAGNLVMGLPDVNFKYTKGTPAAFTRSDLENPVTREFCGNCGTPLLTRAPQLAGAVLLKVGSMDKPEDFVGPDVAIFTDEKYDFHAIAEGVMQFKTVPEM
ncbi:GFA family protein [bacterium]|jgi:hypothetical protein|nr:GFA family protein [bacterium]